MEQEAEIVTATDLIQSAPAVPTTATTESERMQASTSDSTRAQAENVPTEMKAGNEERKEGRIPKCVGKKRTRRRRSQLDDLISGAPSLPQGKRTRSAVDYTPTLDEEETNIPAKELRTLPGARHQLWRVGYARSTINKVLASDQDTGYGIFATSRIKCNAIICTYEGASVHIT